MIKRVVTITSELETLGAKINNFISNELNENECVIDVKILENGRSEQTTVEDKIREVFYECESRGWNLVAYDLNPHSRYENEYLMTVYMEKEE